MPPGGVVEWGHRVEDWQSPGVPVHWPTELADASGRRRAVLVVLSTTCSSCERFAESDLNRLRERDEFVGVVVSTGTEQAAASWLRRHDGIAAFPTYVDAKWEWSRANLGVELSPTAVLVTDGIAGDVYTMSSAEQLDALIDGAAVDGARTSSS